jgi:hypothetical protein
MCFLVSGELADTLTNVYSYQIGKEVLQSLAKLDGNKME